MPSKPTLKRNMTEQLDYAMYLPAVFPPYAEAAIADASAFRPMPGGLAPKDLNFLSPKSKLFYLPAALYSAGHEKKDLYNPKPNMITRRSEDDTLIFGDSGGYQIISGNLHPNNDRDRAAIFNWQDTVCNFAMTLDVPTASIENEKSQYNDFDSCLKDTLAHLKTFHRLHKESGENLKLLNVLQGRSGQEADIWYDHVKHYDFNGWAIAGPLKWDIYEVMRRILILARDGKLGGRYEWLHFLGIGDLKTAALLTVIRDGIREMIGDPDFRISFDTSSPMMSAGKFGRAYTGHKMDRKNFCITAEDFPTTEHKWLGSDELFPYGDSPIARHLKMGDMIVKVANIAHHRTDSLSTFMLMNHNIYIQLYAIYEANKIMTMHRADARELAPSSLLDAKEALNDILHANKSFERLENQRHILDSQ